MWHRAINLLLIVAALIIAKPAHAAFEDELSGLQQRWAAARYQASGDERKKQLQNLVGEADSLAKKYGDKAESHLWAGVIRSSLGEAMGGMGALGVVKEAKANLEKSIAIDAKAADSYAYGILGLMYLKVPGWPIAFGDEKKAKELLQKGIQASPDGMNINYFNAQYYFKKEDYKKAQEFIEKAAQATPPAPAEIWSGRQKEIRELADKIQKELK